LQSSFSLLDIFSQFSSLQAGVHFKLLDIHVHVGSLQDREYVHFKNSNSASGAGSPDIHLISNSSKIDAIGQAY